MSHLIIELGKEVGREVTVPPAGMKFGRSPANDLVLDDDAVMLFHGRLFFKSDGSLWVTDFGAGEKTTVGGIPVDEHPLQVGELVEVGGTAFRIINTNQHESDECPDSPPPEQPGDENVDLGFNLSKDERHSRDDKAESGSTSLIYRVLQVAAVLLVLLIVGLAIPQLGKLGGKSGASGSKAKKQVSFAYERVMGSTKNIFRYHVELTPNRKVTIRIDDLNNRHIAKNMDISEKVAETLAGRLEGISFFEEEGNLTLDASNRYELFDLAISCNGKFNHVRVLNREQPAGVRQAISILEDFVLSELEIPFTLLEKPEALLRYAKEAFLFGEERFAERDVSLGNLAKSIKHYQEALIYLETLEPKPDFYQEALKNMAKAKAEQDLRYQDYMFNVEGAIRLEDWAEASNNLRKLAELVPDRSDDRYEIISSKQLLVEENLR